MKKITGRGVKVLKILHLLLAFMWIGGAFSMMLLFLTTSPQDSHELYMRSLALQLIDDWLIIPGAVGMLISGIVYGVWTNWGFYYLILPPGNEPLAASRYMSNDYTIRFS